MSIISKLTDSKNALDALLSYANDATGAGDADIGEAIRTLVDGYGQGGGSLPSGEFTLTEDATSVTVNIGSQATGVAIWTEDTALINRKCLITSCVWTPNKNSGMTQSGCAVGTSAYNAYVGSNYVTGSRDGDALTVSTLGATVSCGNFCAGATYKWQAI